jgi:DNA-3-methyladenine glycosylase II
MANTNHEIISKEGIDFLTKRSSIFQDILNKYGTPPAWEREPGFETLIKIILEQQVSLESAKAHFIALQENIGEINPSNVLHATEDQLTNSHLSRQKKIYIKALANEILNKGLDLETLNNLEEDEIRSKLINIKGIGNWTVNVYLMMCLKREDIFPIGDIALKNTMKELAGLQTEEEMLKLAEEWRPYRTLATFFMWHNYLSKKRKTLPK